MGCILFELYYPEYTTNCSAIVISDILLFGFLFVKLTFQANNLACDLYFKKSTVPKKFNDAVFISGHVGILFVDYTEEHQLQRHCLSLLI